MVSLSDFGRNWQMGYRYIPDSRSDQQPAADGYSVHRVPGNNNNSINNDSNGGEKEETTARGSYYTAAVVAPLVCHVVNRTVRANGRYLFLSFSEPRAFENIHDSG